MHRRSLLVLASLLAIFALSGCDLRLITPPGDAPLRYRDEIFTSVTKTSDVTYGSAVTQSGQTQTLKLDVYQPDGDTAATRPAIVWIHGGSFKSGTKTSPEIVDEATTFAKKGYLTVSISYRLSANGCTVIAAECLTAIADAWHDAQAAVRFLRAQASTYHIDPGRIATGGTSAGAITALNVAFGSDQVGTSGNPGYSSKVQAAVSLSGAALGTTPEAGEPGALLFHGTADTTVPYQWAVNTYNAAQAAGVTSELTSWEGDGHVPYAQHRDQIITETTNFLYFLLNARNATQ